MHVEIEQKWDLNKSFWQEQRIEQIILTRTDEFVL